jgi:hypothetical protein
VATGIYIYIYINNIYVEFCDILIGPPALRYLTNQNLESRRILNGAHRLLESIVSDRPGGVAGLTHLVHTYIPTESLCVQVYYVLFFFVFFPFFSRFFDSALKRASASKTSTTKGR